MAREPSPSGSERDSTARRFASGAATYALAAILQRAVPFLLLPLFTRILSPEEFGQVGILTTLAAGVIVIVSFGLETAVFRGYLRASAGDADPRAFVSTVGSFAILAPIVASVALALGPAPLLADALQVPIDALRFAAIGAALTAASTLVPLALLRAQERLGSYLQLTGLQVIVTPLLTIVLVAVAELGATGWMLAYMVGSAVLLLRGLVMIRHHWSPDLHVAHLRGALAFGLPLMPHATAHWALAVSDRAILGAFLPIADVGVYYVAYVASLPVMLVAVSLSQATQPLYVEAATSDAARSGLTRVITVHALLVVVLAASVAVIGPALTTLLVPPAYAGAAALMPWLAVGAGLFGLYLAPMNIITLTVGRTSRVWIITVSAALTNVVLNLALVPQFGTMAAAVNTTIGYGLLLVGVFLYARRVCQPPVAYDFARISTGALMVTIPSVGAMVLVPADSAAGLLMRAAVLAIVSIAVVVIGPLRGTVQGALNAWRAAREAGGT